MHFYQNELSVKFEILSVGSSFWLLFICASFPLQLCFTSVCSEELAQSFGTYVREAYGAEIVPT